MIRESSLSVELNRQLLVVAGAPGLILDDQALRRIARRDHVDLVGFRLARIVGDGKLTEVEPGHVREGEYVRVVVFQVGGELGLQLLLIHNCQVLVHVEGAAIILERIIIIERLLNHPPEVLATENLRLKCNVFIIAQVEVHPTVAVLPSLLPALGLLASITSPIASCHLRFVLRRRILNRR